MGHSNALTVFARSDTMATIHFITQFCVPSIQATNQERHLLNSMLSVKPFVNVRALRKGSFMRLTKNYNAVTWF